MSSGPELFHCVQTFIVDVRTLVHNDAGLTPVKVPQQSDSITKPEYPLFPIGLAQVWWTVELSPDVRFRG